MDNKTIINKAANKAYKKAKNKLPEKNMEDVLAMSKAIITSKDKKAAIKKLGIEYDEFVKTMGKEFLTEGFVQYADQKMEQSDNEYVKKLKDVNFSRTLVKTGASIAPLVVDYYQGKINKEKLAVQLVKVCYRDMMPSLLKAGGMDHLEIGKVTKELSDNTALKSVPIEMNPADLMRISYGIVAYRALMEAYKIYQGALKDYKLARDERIRVEKECNKMIDAIVSYRKQMNKDITAYFNEHYDVIESGIEAMDKAILENDVNGYIKGNVEIQKLLGYDVQFTNQEEFDDLMDSDFAFKL